MVLFQRGSTVTQHFQVILSSTRIDPEGREVSPGRIDTTTSVQEHKALCRFAFRVAEVSYLSDPPNYPLH